MRCYKDGSPDTRTYAQITADYYASLGIRTFETAEGPISVRTYPVPDETVEAAKGRIDLQEWTIRLNRWSGKPRAFRHPVLEDNKNYGGEPLSGADYTAALMTIAAPDNGWAVRLTGILETAAELDDRDKWLPTGEGGRVLRYSAGESRYGSASPMMFGMAYRRRIWEYEGHVTPSRSDDKPFLADIHGHFIGCREDGGRFETEEAAKAWVERVIGLMRDNARSFIGDFLKVLAHHGFRGIQFGEQWYYEPSRTRQASPSTLGTDTMFQLRGDKAVLIRQSGEVHQEFALTREDPTLTAAREIGRYWEPFDAYNYGK